MKIHLEAPNQFGDYELIDCGSFEKLERFGRVVLIRPEPQALWDKVLSEKEWGKRAHGRFVAKNSSSGQWQKSKPFDDRWNIQYRNDQIQLQCRLALTSFKHVGIFPEQAPNWDVIAKEISLMKQPKFLNLFAYTGMASLAARAAGADVTHVDSVRQVVTWANENQQLSKLHGIRWVVEDALKFARRELKRGNRYQGIIMDPPAYGHGAHGESWVLEKQINELIKTVMPLLHPDRHLLIVNTYSLGFSSILLQNLIQPHLQAQDQLSIGELILPSLTGQQLPLGVFARVLRIS